MELVPALRVPTMRDEHTEGNCLCFVSERHFTFFYFFYFQQEVDHSFVGLINVYLTAKAMLYAWFLKTFFNVLEVSSYQKICLSMG